MALISFFRSIAFVTFIFRTAHSQSRPKEYSNRILAGMSVLEDAFALDENICFTALHSLKNVFLVLVMEMNNQQCTGNLSVCKKNIIF